MKLLKIVATLSALLGVSSLAIVEAGQNAAPDVVHFKGTIDNVK